MSACSASASAVSPQADVSAETVARAIGQAKARGVSTISKDKSVIARLPISGDAVAYLASEDYDPRDVHSITRAEVAGRVQAWTYSRNLAGASGLGACLPRVHRPAIRHAGEPAHQQHSPAHVIRSQGGRRPWKRRSPHRRAHRPSYQLDLELTASARPATA